MASTMDKIKEIEYEIARCWFDIEVLESCENQGIATTKYALREEAKTLRKIEKLGARKAALVAKM